MEKEIKTGVLTDEDMMVKQIDMGALEEDKGLEVLRAMLVQMVHAVSKNHQTTNEGAYNQFNANKFLKDLDRIEAYVKREFPPKDE